MVCIVRSLIAAVVTHTLVVIMVMIMVVVMVMVVFRVLIPGISTTVWAGTLLIESLVLLKPYLLEALLRVKSHVVDARLIRRRRRKPLLLRQRRVCMWVLDKSSKVLLTRWRLVVVVSLLDTHVHGHVLVACMLRVCAVARRDVWFVVLARSFFGPCCWSACYSMYIHTGKKTED
jgi:hypothetical protein